MLNFTIIFGKNEDDLHFVRAFKNFCIFEGNFGYCIENNNLFNCNLTRTFYWKIIEYLIIIFNIKISLKPVLKKISFETETNLTLLPTEESEINERSQLWYDSIWLNFVSGHLRTRLLNKVNPVSPRVRNTRWHPLSHLEGKPNVEDV